VNQTGARSAQIIIDEPFALRVVIPAPRTPFLVWSRALFLALWTWLWVAAVPPIEDWRRLALALLAWSLVCLLALSSLLWHLRGAEILDVREGTLRLTRIGGGWTRHYTFPLTEVHHLRVTGRGIAFDTSRQTITFAEGLDPEQAGRLARRLLR
jgi:hypothetical protein